jgi:hypothetical protein
MFNKALFNYDTDKGHNESLISWSAYNGTVYFRGYSVSCHIVSTVGLPSEFRS